MRGPTGTVLFRVALVVIALTGAGCSDDPPEAGGLPSNSPSPSTTSSSPTPATPEEQVEATMQAYFEETNKAFQTGDVRELKAMSTSGCPCRRSAESIEKTIKSGGRFEGLKYDVQSIKVHDIDGGTALAEVRADLAPYKVFNSDGDVTEDSPGGTLHTDFSLSRSESGTWIIGNSLNLE